MAGSRHIATAIAVGAALACAACASTSSQGSLTPVAEAEGSTRVQILAVTNRKRSTTDTGEMFTGERSDETSYASVTVAAPPGAAPSSGGIQIPGLTGTTPRDFVTVGADHIDRRDFSAAITSAAKKTGRNRVLVFVHGFNNRFDDAVYRFAQIVHDFRSPSHSGAVHLAVARRCPPELLYLRPRERRLSRAMRLSELLDTIAGQSRREGDQYPRALDGQLGDARSVARAVDPRRHGLRGAGATRSRTLPGGA